MAVLALLVLVCPRLGAQEQESFPGYKISLTGHYGFLISHHSTMQYLVKGHIGGFELTYTKPTYGEEEWHRALNYPEYGFSVLHLELGNPSVLGNLYGAFGFVNFPSGRKKKANFRLGLGMAYLTKHFDRIENHKDIAIGSHLNGLINLGFDRHFVLSKKLLLETGIFLTHASNGSSKVPNLGINMPTINLGLTYDLSDRSKPRNTDPQSPVERKFHLALVGTAGFTEIEPVEGPKYLITELMCNAGWPLNHLWNAVGGIDVLYNTANLEKLKLDSIAVSSDVQNTQLGIKFGGELFVGKLSMPLEMGVYAYTKMTRNGYIYHRLGLRYHIDEHWLVNFTMKTHFAKADYLAWGVGYKF